MEMTVHRGGMLTTVQDLGRAGHRAAGVPSGGAMDPFALRVANSLVGNPESAAALEFTLVGPELEFSADAVVSLGGGEFEGLSQWKPLRVRAGETLKPGRCLHGCRGYLAVAGGIEVKPVLGSRSTYLRARLGGHDGRALRDGDVIPIGPAAATERIADERAHWSIDARILPAYSAAPLIRVLPGAQADEFGAGLFERIFRVSPQSDRMGVRLTGEPMIRGQAEDLLSSALLPGTVQIPPDGNPVVLMADAQTIGGYPHAAHVISVDLPLVAQLRPGDTLRFVAVTLEHAHRLALARDRALRMLREGLAEKRSGHLAP